MKFLVVDDDPIIRKLLTEILVGFGYDDVVSCKSGFDALRALQAQRKRFDCIMLDIQMPEMDGIELCRAVRGMPGYANTPIIMITVMQDISYIRSAFAAGATDYTIKPFDVIELVERIRMAEAIKDPEQARQMAIIRSRSEDKEAALENLVSRAALENYVRNCRLKKLITPAALAIKIAPVEALSTNEIAGAVVRLFDQSEVFMTYLGEGEVLLVCDRFATRPETEVIKLLTRELTNHYHKDSIPPDWEIRTSNWVMPRPYERASDMAFLGRAVADRQNGWWSKASSKSATLAGRLLKIK